MSKPSTKRKITKQTISTLYSFNEAYFRRSKEAIDDIYHVFFENAPEIIDDVYSYYVRWKWDIQKTKKKIDKNIAHFAKMSFEEGFGYRVCLLTGKITSKEETGKYTYIIMDLPADRWRYRKVAREARFPDNFAVELEPK